METGCHSTYLPLGSHDSACPMVLELSMVVGNPKGKL